MHLSKTISVLFICLFKVCVCLLRNTHVVREIKIADVVTKLSANITFVNDGPEVANYYLFHLDYCAKDGYHIEIFQDDLNHLTYETVSDTNAKGEFENSEFKVYLPKQILANDTGTLCINAYYTNCTVPHVTRKFADDQRFIHRSNVEYNSRYYTNYLETRLETAKIGILSTSKKPTRKTGNALYFVFQNIAPNSVNVVKIVFIDNNPHLIVEKLERQIDVSHFGRITVKERVYLENYGPRLVGPYEPTIALLPKTAPVWFFTHLPASVENIRYFDELGNNSFSSIINRYSSKTIRFRLRHPLISGWKSSYALVYQVPTYEYLYKDSGHNYLLRMRALDHVLNDVFVKDVEVRVLLPEGAVVRKVQVPQLFQISDVGFKFNSSLGLFGRPMISFNGKMLSEKHICLFSVGYFVSGLYMWRGPLLVAVYFEAVFIGVIVFQRI